MIALQLVLHGSSHCNLGAPTATHLWSNAVVNSSERYSYTVRITFSGGRCDTLVPAHDRGDSISVWGSRNKPMTHAHRIRTETAATCPASRPRVAPFQGADERRRL